MRATAQTLLDEAGVELVTITVPSLGDAEISRLTLDRFEKERVGSRAPDGRGLLLLFAAAEELVRVEVGYSLEGVLPDLFVGYVEREQMAPYFADGHIGEGVEATVELVAERLFRELGRDGEGIDAGTAVPSGVSGSGGAGAERETPVGGGADRTGAPENVRTALGPQSTPREAWEAFLEIQRRRIKDPTLGLYDEAARSILEQRPNSDAAQRHLVTLYDGTPYEIRQRDDRAVVLFPDDPDHLLAPWFFRRDAEGWRLDGSMYPDVIAYNHRNQWRFRTVEHPYAFAFADYTIDRSGFARRR